MLSFLVAVALADQSPLLQRGHAHNDYEHARPLLDALDNGFCSVEADIFLVDGELRVGHDRNQLKAGRTLQTLYLDPLLARVRENKGSVYSTKVDFTLLVDIKTDGSAVYKELSKVLLSYREMLTKFEEPVVLKSLGKAIPGAVQIVISGDRPAEAREPGASPYIFVDGRVSDLGDVLLPNPRISLISDSFGSLFTWRGDTVMSGEERAKMSWLAEKAHRAGKKIRFWAIPDKPESWDEMKGAGVDLINTDKLAEFRTWWVSKAKG